MNLAAYPIPPTATASKDQTKPNFPLLSQTVINPQPPPPPPSTPCRRRTATTPHRKLLPFIHRGSSSDYEATSSSYLARSLSLSVRYESDSHKLFEFFSFFKTRMQAIKIQLKTHLFQPRPLTEWYSSQHLVFCSCRSMWYAVSAPNCCISYPRRPCSPRFLRKCSVPTSFRVQASLPENDNGAKVEYTPWLIVGLGNPGNKYHGTRHNIGFEMIDSIAKTQGVVMNTIQSKALVGIGSIGEVPILLAKPQAYMNYSGESVGPLAAYYQVPLRHILLVYDEMSLPNGVLRIQPKGGHGYHNGVKSVMGHLDGCREFPRLCIGIGNPPGTMDMKAYLLQRFSTIERHQIDAALDQGVEAVRTLVLNGFDQSITSFNLRQKYKYHKV
ncbi:unnamed protein product [Prunus brigantina]